MLSVRSAAQSLIYELHGQVVPRAQDRKIAIDAQKPADLLRTGLLVHRTIPVKQVCAR